MGATGQSGTVNQPPTRTPLPIVSLGPEALFRIHDLTDDGAVTTGSMETGPWMAGTDGQVCAGSLGVLVDNALGYAVISERPAGHWSVSAEVSIELCAPVPMDGSGLRAEASLVQADRSGGLATGRVLDAEGRVVALCSQRGRFVDPDQSELATSGWDAAGDPLMTSRLLGTPALIGARVELTPDGAALHLTASPRLANPLGNLHGGISLCASEIVGLAAINRAGSSLSTASVHVVYARPMPLGTDVTFRATVTHQGRSLAVAQVISTATAGKPCTIATVTAHAT